MKKLSLLVALALLITVGGVYATWTYTQKTDVADEAVSRAMNLTSVVYADSYGTYNVDHSTLLLSIDPKAGTAHTTSLVITGEIKVTFTPATHAPVEIKQNGVPTWYTFSLSNNDWTFDDDTTDEVAAKKIVTLAHEGVKEEITWHKEDDGTFTCTFDAATLANHISLTEFVLDTKVDYDRYSTALTTGQIIFGVTDGQTASDT